LFNRCSRSRLSSRTMTRARRSNPASLCLLMSLSGSAVGQTRYGVAAGR
jgi:hypothetical protein